MIIGENKNKMQISIIFDGVPKFNVKVFAHEFHFFWPIVSYCQLLFINFFLFSLLLVSSELNDGAKISTTPCAL